MSNAIESALDKVAQYCADDSHGYELGMRDYSFGTDCSGLARMYAAYVESISPNRYPDMSTRNMREILTSRGWSAATYSGFGNVPRGGILLTNRRGHTVIKVNDSEIFGAEGDWDGVPGDSSGSEICRRSFYEYDWDWVIWWPSAGTVEVAENTGELAIDGFWGNKTSIKLANILGTPADGIVSSQSNYWKAQNPGLTSGWEWIAPKYAVGSQLIGAIQGKCGVKVDYLIGPNTINGIIRRFAGETGAIQDGKFDAASMTIKAIQRHANNGEF